MEYVLVFVAGALSAFGLLRIQTHLNRRPTPSSRTVRLQEIAERLAATGDASAHPRDLAENSLFREAVTILSSSELPVSVVLDYASGAHLVLASAAWAALSERPERDEMTAALAREFQHLSAWPTFYALRAFARINDRPAIGQMVLQVNEHWIDHPLMASMFAEHFAARATLGDPPEFGNGLDSAEPAKVAAAEHLLRKIDHPAAPVLLNTLEGWRRKAVDRAYLQSIGRLVEADAERLLVIEHAGILEQLARAEVCLLQDPYRSVLVVGEPRSGKTSFLAAVAGRAAEKGWRVFEAGAAEILAGQQYIGQVEERLRRLTTELAVEKRVLWLVPDFHLFASSGRHQFQTASLLDLLFPAIAAGKLIILSETTPAGLAASLRTRPALPGALEVVRLPPMADAEIERFTAAFATRYSEVTQIDIGPDVLETAGHLARHYFGTSQMPGAVIDLLKRTAQRVIGRAGTRMERGDVLEILSQLTGLPPLVIDDRERLDLAALRGFFSARVIGQDEGIDAVVDRIAMLKAGLIDPSRPIAVFLFAGPTGTGKTELAKTLAEFLFGSSERLIRLDMSEFQTAESTRKILGDADQDAEAQSLAQQVRRHPFSVVLLDEFEKAHPDIWDFFLQVFDDGRLTDAMGQTSDFRHCLIILTSNLGARIPQGLGVGFGSTAAAFSQDQVLKTVHQTFRPEFVNRLDAVIVFRPLSRDLMRGILTKELTRVLDRRGLRDRDWAVEWEPSALEFLLDKGFSPTMGARPLKRAIDRHLLAPLAATLVEHRFPEGDQFLFVRSDGRELQVDFVDPDAPSAPATPETPEQTIDARLTLARMILQPAGTRDEQSALSAELRRLESSLQDERWVSVQAEIAIEMQQPGFWDRADRLLILSRYALMDRIRAAIETAKALDDRLQRFAASGRASRDLVTRLASQLHVIRHGLDDLWLESAAEVALTAQPVFESSDERLASVGWSNRLLDMYRRWASRRHMQIEEMDGSAAAPTVLVISGFGAARVLFRESGLHILEYTRGTDHESRAVARVRVAATPPESPGAAGQHAAALRAVNQQTSSAVVRRYRLEGAPLIRDALSGWRTGRVQLVMDGDFDLLAELLPTE